MRPTATSLILTAALLVACGSVVADFASSPDQGKYERTPIGHWLFQALRIPVPAFGAAIAPILVSDRAGRPVRLPNAGRAQLINYWASWCGPCRREAPLFEDFVRRTGSKGPELVGIAMEPAANVEAYLAANRAPFQHVYIEPPSDHDSSVRLGNQLGLLPYSVLVDAQGRFLARKIGPFKSVRELEAWAALAR